MFHEVAGSVFGRYRGTHPLQHNPWLDQMVDHEALSCSQIQKLLRLAEPIATLYKLIRYSKVCIGAVM